MELRIKQFSSLEKIRTSEDLKAAEIHKKSVLAGERLSYQICLQTRGIADTTVSVESELSDHIRLYNLKNAYMDLPSEANVTDEDYLTNEPGMMPDILVPLDAQDGKLTLFDNISTIWVKLDVPKETLPGTYQIKIKFTIDCVRTPTQPIELCQVMNVTVVPAVIPEQKLIYTRWFYADCVAVQHNVEIHSEEYWALIEKYIAAAADMGINMILVPVHTPPLDTDIGSTRPCVQLVDIEKKGNVYEFRFDKFKRFIDICKKCGIKYYEMAHMFSQWGARFTPNIMVTENGKTDYMFGWHVAADSPEYVSFLKQYIAAIYKELEAEGISQNTYFHVSDEPTLSNMDTYQTASGIIRPLIEKSKTFDALSNYEFYEKGLVECPVTSVSHIHEFLDHDIENQWAYYCCLPQRVFTNSFMAMPSYRTRILGFLLYKYNIKGFLHWGFNFYNARHSKYPINPYLTTSADGAFSSGDPFVVYPGKDDVYSSIRGEVTYEAIQDMDICFALEELIGREEVVKMIDDAAGRDLRFDDYPRGKEFIEGLRDKMVRRIALICEK